ncbi:hypothetical protein ACJX0J_006190, partial [Zea mays]
MNVGSAISLIDKKYKNRNYYYVFYIFMFLKIAGDIMLKYMMILLINIHYFKLQYVNNIIYSFMFKIYNLQVSRLSKIKLMIGLMYAIILCLNLSHLLSFVSNQYNLYNLYIKNRGMRDFCIWGLVPWDLTIGLICVVIDVCYC